MYDFLDLEKDSTAYPFTGTHFSERPTSKDSEGAYFDYEMVDPTEWHYQKLFGNILNNDGATTTIRSNDDMGWKIGQYVALQDDGLYKVVSALKDYQSANKEVFRLLKDAPQIDFVIRLIEADNPWGVQ